MVSNSAARIDNGISLLALPQALLLLTAEQGLHTRGYYSPFLSAEQPTQNCAG